jgi:hypothetical protein
VEKYLNRLPDSVRSGLNTAIFSFLGIFLPSLLGWLGRLSESVDGGTPLPSVSTLGKAAFSAALAVLIGLINTAFRAVQAKTGRGNPPKYSK